MSDGKTPASVPEPKVSPLIPQMKDALMVAGWIAGLIIMAVLCWVLTQQLRNRFLLNAVNKVLEESYSPYRLSEPVPPSPASAGGAAGRGALAFSTWYKVVKIRDPAAGQVLAGTNALIFTFIAEGSFFPCAAIVTSDRKVEEFIPLNGQGERIMKRVSPGIFRIYIRRIQGPGS